MPRAPWAAAARTAVIWPGPGLGLLDRAVQQRRLDQQGLGQLAAWDRRPPRALTGEADSARAAWSRTAATMRRARRSGCRPGWRTRR